MAASKLAAVRQRVNRLKKRICIVTATRAEYGLLKPVILKLQSKKDLDRKSVV